jgi:hypothetical protein
MLIINDLQKKNAGFWQKKAQKGGFIRNLGEARHASKEQP